MIDQLPKDKDIVLYDGVCKLCNRIVHWIITHDKKDQFRFVALQSEKGKDLQRYLGLSPQTDTLILYQPGVAYYTKSAAVITILKKIGGIYYLSSVFSYLPHLANFIYDQIAKNRYKKFGKYDTCLVPTPEIEAKFL